MPSRWSFTLVSGPENTHDDEQWLRWWKLGVIALLCGGVASLFEKLLGIDAILIFFTMSACIVLAFTFFVVEIRSSEAEPSFELGDKARPNHRAINSAVLAPIVVPLLSVIIAALIQLSAGGQAGSGAECRQQEPFLPYCAVYDCSGVGRPQ
jgi:hypothetical protein